MRHAALSSFMQMLRRDAGRHARDEQADAKLLARFVRQGDAAAFEVLVHRHGPMVWSVCRRLLTRTEDAEDAFQAAFVVLLRRAGSIREGSRLGNWLYGVAYRAAVRARARAARHAAREPLAAAVRSGLGSKEPKLARRRRRMVEFLLKRGAATNLPDDEPWATPLAWARKLGLADIEEILLKHGATG
jgi:RNA polymerase sigma factor (sigma-70 family)